MFMKLREIRPPAVERPSKHANAADRFLSLMSDLMEVDRADGDLENIGESGKIGEKGDRSESESRRTGGLNLDLSGGVGTSGRF